MLSQTLSALVPVLLVLPAAADVLSDPLPLTPSDGQAGDEFGAAVALEGTTLVVGAPDHGAVGIDAGAAYVFDLATGSEVRKLLPADLTERDAFGAAVAIEGDWIVVGAPVSGELGAAPGAVYVFDRATGQEVRKLQASDAFNGELFGSALALDGGRLLIGAYQNDDSGNDSGAVYVFDVATGQELRKLLPTDGAPQDLFGFAVALDGATALVSALLEDEANNDAGAAYLFDVDSGAQLHKLVPSDAGDSDRFGQSVALEGDLALVGATRHMQDFVSSGTAYLFDVPSGAFQRELVPLDAAAGDDFGEAVALVDGWALVGAPGRNASQGGGAGGAFLFDAASGEQLAEFLSDLALPFGTLGSAAAFAGDRLVVGDFFGNGSQNATGIVYALELDRVDALASSRNGSGTNALRLANVSAPVLGTDWETDLDCSGHAPSFASLEAFLAPSSGLFLAGGELLVDVTSGQAARAQLPHAGGVERFAVPLPLDLGLCGLEVSVQGLVLGAPGYELTNALDLTLGF